MTYPCSRCNRDDGYPICAGDERCQRTDGARIQRPMTKGSTDIVNKLRSLKVLLGTDSPEVRGWAPAVQQQAQKVVNEAIAALAAAAQPAPAWQPINTAPQDGTEFLGYRRGNLATAYRVPRDDCEMWVFGNESGAYERWPEVRPTHWMPKPPAPGA